MGLVSEAFVTFVTVVQSIQTRKNEASPRVAEMEKLKIDSGEIWTEESRHWTQ